MIILGNDVASQKEFDAHVAAEKEEHAKLIEQVGAAVKENDVQIGILQTKLKQLEKQNFVASVVLGIVALVGVIALVL